MNQTLYPAVAQLQAAAGCGVSVGQTHDRPVLKQAMRAAP